MSLQSLKQAEYCNDAMLDLVDVMQNDKQLMIVSAGKSIRAYETVIAMADRADLYVATAMLRCEDGQMHEHVFVGSRDPNDLYRNRATECIALVYKHKEGDDFTRANFQFLMGKLLGTPVDEVLDFIASATGRSCVCDCCGGKASILED